MVTLIRAMALTPFSWASPARESGAGQPSAAADPSEPCRQAVCYVRRDRFFYEIPKFSESASMCRVGPQIVAAGDPRCTPSLKIDPQTTLSKPISACEFCRSSVALRPKLESDFTVVSPFES